MHILVLDIETPWVRSLFLATPPGVRVTFLGVLNIRERRMKPQSLLGMFTSKPAGANHSDAYVWVPARLKRLSRVCVQLYCRALFAKHGRPDAVVACYPGGADLIDAFGHARRVYYAHDPFEYYKAFDPAKVHACEQRLLEQCNLVTAVSGALVEDFARRRSSPTRYLPNATRRDWLDTPPGPRPADLPDTPRLVGCVGQMNATYDWDLLNAVISGSPATTFVFVGPNAESDADVRARMQQVLTLPNVVWLGPRPPETLMGYMHAFGVCLCPLKPGPHADRRSPLRLYDALATDRPVVCTDIAEAHAHAPHVLIARDASALNTLIDAVFDGTYAVDVSARRAYMDRQTWDVRASQLVTWIEETERSSTV